MLARLIPASLVAVFLAGCGKPSQTSPPATALSGEPRQTAVAPSAPDPTQAADGADLAASLAELTQAVRKYSFEHRRVPNTLGELVAAGYLQKIPQAPAGKKFAIEPKTVQVVLVKQ